MSSIFSNNLFFGKIILISEMKNINAKEEKELTKQNIRLTREFKEKLMLHQLRKLINAKLNELSHQKIKRIHASKVQLFACFIGVGEIGKSWLKPNICLI